MTACPSAPARGVRFVPLLAAVARLATLSALLAATAGACRDAPPTPSAARGGSPEAPAGSRQGADADPGTRDALQSAVEAMAAAAAAGDTARCRALVSQATRAILDARGGRGWAAFCAAHAGLSWPKDAGVLGNGDGAVLEAAGVAGPVRVPFLREDGAWRIDYARHEDAAALRTLQR